MGGLLKLRIEPGDASEIWKRSEGRTVDGKFQLLSYLAGSEDSAVFLTSIKVEGGSEEAVIKLIYAGTVDVEKQLLRWKSARELSHPNLLRVFDTGRCEIDGMQLLYVVQEYAEENLAQILPERALTPEETEAMLPVVLGALQYLHEKGFAHGRLQPSNILAKGDQLKLSSDALVALGEKSHRGRAASVYDPPSEAASDTVSAASDVWRLGITLTEVLTQHLPAWDRAASKLPEIPRSMPEPFRDITKHCLQVEPDKRWTIAQIVARLEAEPLREHLESPPALALVQSENLQPERMPSATPLSEEAVPVVSERQKSPAKWPYLLILAAAVVVVIVLIVRPKAPAPTSAVQSAQQQSAGATTEGSQGAHGPTQPGLTQSQISPTGDAVNNHSSNSNGTNSEAINTIVSNSAAQDGVTHRVVPDVSPAARRSIHGRILVRVKVQVDPAGNVTKASPISDHVSKYFSRLALESAQDWKFSPETNGTGSGNRQWILQFAFTRAKTEVSAAAASH